MLKHEALDVSNDLWVLRSRHHGNLVLQRGQVCLLAKLQTLDRNLSGLGFKGPGRLHAKLQTLDRNLSGLGSRPSI